MTDERARRAPCACSASATQNVRLSFGALLTLSRGTAIATAVSMRSPRLLVLTASLALSLLACRSVPQLRAEATQVPTGKDVVVTIDGSLDGRAFDRYWIALQPANAPDDDVRGRIVLDRQEHEVHFPTTTPGPYEVRLHDRYPKTEHHLVARLPIQVDGYRVKTGEPLEPARRN